MLIALWLLTLLAIGLWSLTAWGLHAVLTLNTGTLGELKPLIDQIPHADVISQWIPGWQQMLQATIDLTQVLLGWLGGAAPIIVWVLWGLGVVTLLGIAGVLTVLVRLIRRKAPRPASVPA